MPRPLPPGLSDAQRSALLAFFSGHITAGQLTERLGIDVPARAADGPTTQPYLSRVAADDAGRNGGGDHQQAQETRKRLAVREIARKWLRRSHRTVRPGRQPAV